MNTYKIRILIEDSNESEVLTVEAETENKATNRAMLATKLRAGGRLVRFYNVETNQEILGNF